MDKIKQQKIELNKDERNSTNNKSENDRLNIILSVIDRIYEFRKYKCLPDKQPDSQQQPDWQHQPDQPAVQADKNELIKAKNLVNNIDDKKFKIMHNNFTYNLIDLEALINDTWQCW